MKKTILFLILLNNIIYANTFILKEVIVTPNQCTKIEPFRNYRDSIPN
jgi:hypothetical protein